MHLRVQNSNVWDSNCILQIQLHLINSVWQFVAKKYLNIYLRFILQQSKTDYRYQSKKYCRALPASHAVMQCFSIGAPNAVLSSCWRVCGSRQAGVIPVTTKAFWPQQSTWNSKYREFGSCYALLHFVFVIVFHLGLQHLMAAGSMMWYQGLFAKTRLYFVFYIRKPRQHVCVIPVTIKVFWPGQGKGP